MPYSSGTWSLTSGFPPVTGTVISSSTMTTFLEDLRDNGMSFCVLKDGTQTITANIPMAGFKFTGLGAGSSSADSATIGGTETLTNKTLTSPTMTAPILGVATATGIRSGGSSASWNASTTLTLSSPTLANSEGFLVSMNFIKDTNDHSPGMYFVSRRGTQVTVTAIIALSGLTIAMNGSDQMTFTNGSATNGTLSVNVLKVVYA